MSNTPISPPPSNSSNNAKFTPVIIIAAIGVPVILLGFCICCGLGVLVMGGRGASSSQFTRDQVRALEGRTQAEVKNKLGRPTTATEYSSGKQTWSYHNVLDPISGQTGIASLVFDRAGGVVIEISF